MNDNHVAVINMCASGDYEKTLVMYMTVDTARFVKDCKFVSKNKPTVEKKTGFWYCYGNFLLFQVFVVL